MVTSTFWRLTALCAVVLVATPPQVAVFAQETSSRSLRGLSASEGAQSPQDIAKDLSFASGLITNLFDVVSKVKGVVGNLKPGEDGSQAADGGGDFAPTSSETSPDENFSTPSSSEDPAPSSSGVSGQNNSPSTSSASSHSARPSSSGTSGHGGRPSSSGVSGHGTMPSSSSASSHGSAPSSSGVSGQSGSPSSSSTPEEDTMPDDTNEGDTNNMRRLRGNDEDQDDDKDLKKSLSFASDLMSNLIDAVAKVSSKSDKTPSSGNNHATTNSDSAPTTSNANNAAPQTEADADSNAATVVKSSRKEDDNVPTVVKGKPDPASIGQAPASSAEKPGTDLLPPAEKPGTDLIPKPNPTPAQTKGTPLNESPAAAKPLSDFKPGDVNKNPHAFGLDSTTEPPPSKGSSPKQST